MALVPVGGAGLYMPTLPNFLSGTGVRGVLDVVLDAHEEEFQVFANVTIAGGGTKTFGTAGSRLGWHVGVGPITFATGATLRVGVKQASKMDLVASASPARATLGAAAFDVATDLVGGVDLPHSAGMAQRGHDRRHPVQRHRWRLPRDVLASQCECRHPGRARAADDHRQRWHQFSRGHARDELGRPTRSSSSCPTWR